MYSDKGCFVNCLMKLFHKSIEQKSRMTVTMSMAGNAFLVRMDAAGQRDQNDDSSTQQEMTFINGEIFERYGSASCKLFYSKLIYVIFY